MLANFRTQPTRARAPAELRALLRARAELAQLRADASHPADNTKTLATPGIPPNLMRLWFILTFKVKPF